MNNLKLTVSVAMAVRLSKCWFSPIVCHLHWESLCCIKGFIYDNLEQIQCILWVVRILLANCTSNSTASETVSYPTFSIQHCGSSVVWTLLSLGVKLTSFCFLQDFVGKELEFFMNLCHMDQIFISYGGEPKDRVPPILCLFVSCP